MKIAMIGYGRMGNIIVPILKQRGHDVVIIDPQVPEADYKEINEESMNGVDVCIEFTHPTVAMDNIKALCSLKKKAVIGTTGWYDQLDEVNSLVKESGNGLLWASNFSIGMNIFFTLNEFMAKLMNKFPDYDVAGLEYHHNQKADSPSGTARSIAEILQAGIDRKKSIVYDIVNRKIKEDELHFASVRCGSIPGTHKVIFDTAADSLELTHTARNREGFGLGAVIAAEWVADKTGCFEIKDMFTEILEGAQ